MTRAVQTALAGAGGVLQIVSSRDNTIVTTSGNSEGALFSLNITPISASSKILLLGSFSAGCWSGSSNVTMHFGRVIGGVTTYPGRFLDGSRVGGVCGGEVYSTNPSEHMSNFSGQFLDEPATTSQITYSLRYACYDTAVIFGRVQSTADANWASRTYHTLSLIEIAG